MAAKKKARGKKKAAKKKAASKRSAKTPKKKAAKKPANPGAAHPDFIAGQFQPGQSGNPNGRPKKKTFDEAVMELLDVEITDDGKTRMEQIAIFLLDDVINKRSGKALRELMSRIWPVKTRVQLSSDPEAPIVPVEKPTDLSMLTDAELRIMARISKKVADGSSDPN